MRLRTVFRVGWRYLSRHPWQTGLLIIGIVLGVAVMVAIDLANSSASRAFELSTDAISGKATHQILGTPNGFDEKIYEVLIKAGSDAILTPIVQDYVTSLQLGNRPFTLLGIDPFTDTSFRNYFSKDGQVPIQQLTSFLTIPGAVIMSSDVANRYGLAPCEKIANQDKDLNSCSFTIQTNGTQKQVFLVGLIDPVDRLASQALDTIVLADIATAQELLGKLGRLDRIDVIIGDPAPKTPSTDQTTLNSLRAFLPDNLHLQPVAAKSGTVQEMTEAFQV